VSVLIKIRTNICQFTERGETAEDENGYPWACLLIGVFVVSSIFLVLLCVDKTKTAKKKKSKVSKSGDSPGKHSNDSDSNIVSVDFSLSRKDLISSREGTKLLTFH
jgi:hypothetical protein